MSHRFDKYDSLLKILERAQISKICWFSDHDFMMNQLEFISPLLLSFSIDPDVRDQVLLAEKEGKSLEDFILNNQGIIISSESRKIYFEFAGGGYVLKELLRRDFSNEGYEEVLCTFYEYAIRGTHGAGAVIILKKDALNDLAYFEIFPY
jgi:hypothetical protein